MAQPAVRSVHLDHRNTVSAEPACQTGTVAARPSMPTRTMHPSWWPTRARHVTCGRGRYSVRPEQSALLIEGRGDVLVGVCVHANDDLLHGSRGGTAWLAAPIGIVSPPHQVLTASTSDAGHNCDGTSGGQASCSTVTLLSGHTRCSHQPRAPAYRGRQRRRKARSRLKNGSNRADRRLLHPYSGTSVDTLLVRRFPLAELRRQVAPGGLRADNPDDAAKDHTVIVSWSTHRRSLASCQLFLHSTRASRPAR